MEGSNAAPLQNPIDLIPLPPNLISPFKTNSLARMDDLELSLNRCDEPSYTENYYNVSEFGAFNLRYSKKLYEYVHILNLVVIRWHCMQALARMSPHKLYDSYKSLKGRMEWLASEEATEFTRVAALNVLNQSQLFTEGSLRTPLPSSMEADAFIQNVFGGPQARPTNAEVKSQTITPDQFIVGGPDSIPSAVEQHQLLRSGITPFTERALATNHVADGDVEDSLHGIKPAKTTRQTMLGVKRKQEDIIYVSAQNEDRLY